MAGISARNMVLAPWFQKASWALPVPLKSRDRLVMVLRLAALLNNAPFPRNVRVELRIRVLPPPHFVALPVPAKDQVEVAVAVDVIRHTARLNRQIIFIEHVAIPACCGAPIPHQRRRHLAEADHEIVDAVFIEISHHRTGLLSRRTRFWQLPFLAGKLLPLDLRRFNGNGNRRSQRKYTNDLRQSDQPFMNA